MRCYFNPRSSCEERRALIAVQHLEELISIHAPHARSDLQPEGIAEFLKISIHAPHARSDMSGWGSRPTSGFQSTLLMRGATGRG